MKYAIIETGGKQYKVTEGSVITVDRLPVEVDTVYTFPDVLLFVDGDIKVGTPTLSDVFVVGKVLEHTKGEKIRVLKFKAKAKYRRSTGFRAFLTKVQIESIGAKSEKKETKKSEKSAPKSEEK